MSGQASCTHLSQTCQKDILVAASPRGRLPAGRSPQGACRPLCGLGAQRRPRQQLLHLAPDAPLSPSPHRQTLWKTGFSTKHCPFRSHSLLNLSHGVCPRTVPRKVPRDSEPRGRLTGVFTAPRASPAREKGGASLKLSPALISEQVFPDCPLVPGRTCLRPAAASGQPRTPWAPALDRPPAQLRSALLHPAHVHVAFDIIVRICIFSQDQDIEKS